MSRTSSVCSIVLAALCLSACTRVVGADPGDAVALVALDAAFEPDSTLRIFVARTLPLGVPSSSAYGEVTDARVILSDVHGAGLPFSDSTGFGTYTSDADLRPGATYTLTVDVPNLPRATSTFTVPTPVSGFEAEGGPDAGDPGADFEVVVRFRDPPGEGNRYLLSVLSQRPGQFDSEKYFETTDPSIRDESFFDAVRSGPGGRAYSAATFTDALFDGTRHEIRIRVRAQIGGGGADPSDQYAVDLRVCSQAYFDDYRAGIRAGGPTNPFAEASAPPSNVEGGLGTVGAFVRQRVALN